MEPRYEFTSFSGKILQWLAKTPPTRIQTRGVYANLVYDMFWKHQVNMYELVNYCKQTK